MMCRYSRMLAAPLLLVTVGIRAPNSMTLERPSTPCSLLLADGVGFVTWSSVCNFIYYVEENLGSSSVVERWELLGPTRMTKALRDKWHQQPVDRIRYCAALDKYFTAGRRGAGAATHALPCPLPAMREPAGATATNGRWGVAAAGIALSRSGRAAR